MSATNESWLKRHPVLTLLAFNALIFLFVAMAAEIALRIYVPYNPGFYMSVGGTSREVLYSYGLIRINSDGFPDDEFDLTKPLKVGYFGDSVTYGVGAGHGYRFSDLLAESYPEYEHMNFAGIGLTVSQDTIDSTAELAKKFDLGTVIYFFNLNDIVPDRMLSGDDKAAVRQMRGSVLSYLDWFRGRSYLYTSLRTAAKNFLEARGVGFHGYAAYELFPERERATLEETANRINDFHRTLGEQGVELVVVMLPYEMQISQDAEETYLAHGIHWEEGFIERRTQEIMIEYLADDVRYFDAYPAFVDPHDPDKTREKIKVGEYFVYNKGDKLDWNHPNRAGHRAIADYLSRVPILTRGAHADSRGGD